MSDEYKRLNEVAKKYFENLGVLAIKIGKTQGYFYSYKNTSNFGRQLLDELRIKANINPDFIMTGNGNMLISDQDISIKETEHKGVPFYPIDVTASFVRSFDDIQAVPDFYVDFKPLNDCTAYFTVVGDSMYPKYSPGEIIAIKKIVNHDYIQWGEAYLVITTEEANSMRTIKLVHKHKDRRFIILRSANPQYKGDMEVAKEHILEMFIVKGRVKLENL